MQVVAVGERDDRRREEAAALLGAAGYRDVEAFLAHAMDAVILVNDFDQHAPVAIRALEQGLSVLSETAACRTLAEGVALIEAAERSSGVYMFAARGRRLVPRSAGPLTENATDGSSLHHGQPSSSRRERNDL
jgi:predicted dehydrogenase